MPDVKKFEQSAEFLLQQIPCPRSKYLELFVGNFFELISSVKGLKDFFGFHVLCNMFVLLNVYWFCMKIILESGV